MNKISLVEQLKADNEKAFDHIFKEMHYKLYCYCLRFTKVKEDAEEIVQEVFVILWKKRKDLDVSLSVDSLLYKISKDLCFNYLKKQSRDRLFKTAFQKQVTDTDGQTEDLIQYNEYLRLASTAISQLPPQRQEIFRKSKLEGKNYQEIASEMRISPNTVKGQLVKATKGLKKYLQEVANITLMMLLLIGKV